MAGSNKHIPSAVTAGHDPWAALGGGGAALPPVSTSAAAVASQPQQWGEFDGAAASAMATDAPAAAPAAPEIEGARHTAHWYGAGGHTLSTRMCRLWEPLSITDVRYILKLVLIAVSSACLVKCRAGCQKASVRKVCAGSLKDFELPSVSQLYAMQAMADVQLQSHV